MQILRLPPFPLSLAYEVPAASTAYKLVIKDDSSNTVALEVASITSSAASKITYELPEDFNKYDASYHVEIFEVSSNDTVVEDTLEIKRPYIDPSSLGSTATEITEYTNYEMLARAVIDSIVPGGFYYEVDEIDAIGQGTDYMPLWSRAYKILKVYENALLVYDVDDEDGPALGSWNYFIITDKTAISAYPVSGAEEVNRSERKRARMSLGASDSIAMFDTEDSGNTLTVQPGVLFPEGHDYVFILEAGYKVVPLDIKEATKMLINDIKCGKLDYYKRYITNYATDQFRVQMDKSFLNGTGNLLVDKILSKYITDIGKPGVL